MSQYFPHQSYNDFGRIDTTQSTPVITTDIDIRNLDLIGYPSIDVWDPPFIDLAGDKCNSMDFDISQLSSSYDYSWTRGDIPASNASSNENNRGSTSSPSPSSSHKQERSEIERRYHRRREQNRTAQRTYRDRKAQHLTDLERELSDARQKLRHLLEENSNLLKELCRAKEDNGRLRETIEDLYYAQQGGAR